MEDNGEFFTPPTLRDIVSVACDMGGTNISYQNLKTAYSGISEAKKVSDWKYDSEEEKKRTLNAINMLGYTNAGNNQQLADERNQIWQAKKLKYPKLQFNFDETFTNNMLNNFSWGGDWWTQKDYMHFQKK